VAVRNKTGTNRHLTNTFLLNNYITVYIRVNSSYQVLTNSDVWSPCNGTDSGCSYLTA